MLVVEERLELLPRALVLATLVVTGLYVTLNWIFVHAAPVQELAGREDVAAIAARALGGARLEALVRVVLVLALATSISSMVMIGPRVVARMADDGLLPRRLGFTGRVPAAAIGLQVALALAILWTSGLRQQLTNLGWILGLFTAISVVGLLRLRRREGPARVPIRGHPLVPAAFLALVLPTTGAMLLVRGRELLPSVTILATGALAYGLARRNPRGVR